MDYQLFYDFVIHEEEELKKQDIADNYRLCKALAACYELHEYIANRLGEMVDRGEISDQW